MAVDDDRDVRIPRRVDYPVNTWCRLPDRPLVALFGAFVVWFDGSLILVSCRSGQTILAERRNPEFDS